MGQSYRELLVWRKSVQLVKAIYLATRDYPDDERYGLRSQMRRAAVSVPSNIAEGQSRYSQKEFLRFLSNARGSLSELETQVTLSLELNLVAKKIADSLLRDCGEVGRMLNGLYNSIELRTENRELGTKR